ncbi:hypothetical protein Tco_0529078 [Tanacetum coccineum]
MNRTEKNKVTQAERTGRENEPRGKGRENRPGAGKALRRSLQNALGTERARRSRRQAKCLPFESLEAKNKPELTKMKEER